MIDPSSGEWTSSHANVFWDEIAQHDRVLQVYASEEILLDALTGFVGSGINSGDCTVVIATAAHINALNQQLRRLGVHPASLISEERYIPLAADTTLEKFMVNGMPDKDRFSTLVRSLLNRGRRGGSKTRFFGEMVAVLWADHNKKAARRLEELWAGICASETFGMFCAYPEAGFTDNKTDSIQQLSDCHDKVINGNELQLQQVYYKEATTVG